MLNLKKYIQGKVVFLGVGNPMRGDDGAGCLFVEELKKSGKLNSSNIHFFNAAQVPENFLEPIVKIKPNTIFIVDAVDFDASPGKAKLFQKISSHLTFSTHTLPLNFVFDYLKEKTKAHIFILGIQPATLKWGADLSPKVKKTIKELINQL